MLFFPEKVLSEKDAALLNPLQLAYAGDAAWELMIRSHLALRKLNVHHMHTECVRAVNAAAQARHLERIWDTLSEKETEIVLRGRNAHARHPAPKHQDPGDYAGATGFEALIGYLYLTGNIRRMEEIEKQFFEGNGSHG